MCEITITDILKEAHKSRASDNLVFIVNKTWKPEDELNILKGVKSRSEGQIYALQNDSDRVFFYTPAKLEYKLKRRD